MRFQMEEARRANERTDDKTRSKSPEQNKIIPLIITAMAINPNKFSNKVFKLSNKVKLSFTLEDFIESSRSI